MKAMSASQLANYMAVEIVENNFSEVTQDRIDSIEAMLIFFVGNPKATLRLSNTEYNLQSFLKLIYGD